MNLYLEITIIQGEWNLTQLSVQAVVLAFW